MFVKEIRRPPAPLLRDLDHQLADICALEQPIQGSKSILKGLDDGFTMLQFVPSRTQRMSWDVAAC